MGPLWTAAAREWTLVDPGDKSIMQHYLPKGVNDFVAKLTIDCPMDSSLPKVLSQLILYKHPVGKSGHSKWLPHPTPSTHTSTLTHTDWQTVHTCRYGLIPNGYQSAMASLTQMGPIDKSSSSSGCQLWLNKQAARRRAVGGILMGIYTKYPICMWAYIYTNTNICVYNCPWVAYLWLSGFIIESAEQSAHVC